MAREVPLKEHLLTVTDVCELLRASPTFVYRHARELGAIKLGRHLRFRRAGVEEWLDQQRLETADWNPDWAQSGTGRSFLSVPTAKRTKRGARRSRTTRNSGRN